MSSDGSTTGVRDFVARFPLLDRQSCIWRRRGTSLRLFTLQGREVCLDLVVLREFALNIVIDASQFLGSKVSDDAIQPKRHPVLTFCRESINSANDLSARYLTLFQLKVRR